MILHKLIYFTLYFMPVMAILLFTWMTPATCQKLVELSFNWVKCVGGLYCAWLFVSNPAVNVYTAGAITFFCLNICWDSLKHFRESYDSIKPYNYIENLRYHLDCIVLYVGLIFIAHYMT